MGMPRIETERMCPEHAAVALIYSVAMVETALANILDGEGDKLQKAVCMSNNINDLLRINESIATTLENATALEGILKAKLDAAAELLNGKQNNCCRR